MAKRGRKPKGYKPEITERNKWLADDFIKLIGKYYKQMRDYDKGGVIDWDIFGDTIMAVHQSILWNGCDKPIYITSDTSEEERYRIYRYKVFTSYQINVNKPQDRHTVSDDYNECLTLRDEPSSKKTKDMYDDIRTMEILNFAEENAEPIAFYCFRLYYLIDNMSYSRLRQITGVKGCRDMVVSLRKTIQQHIGEINDRVNEKMADFTD